MLYTQHVRFSKNRRNLAPVLAALPVLAVLAMVCAACILSSVQSASAAHVGTHIDVIIDGEGFESSYVAGNLEGQAAVLPNDAPFPGAQAWLAATGTNSTAVVQSAVFEPTSGSQAVKVTREVGDAPSFWGVPVTAWPDSARYVCIVWDMLVEGPSGTPPPAGGDFGPYFGVDAIDDAGVGANEGLIGSMGVLATTGQVVYTDNVQGGSLKPTGATVAFNTWNRFHIDLDFQESEYTLYLNDPLLQNPLITVPFVGGSSLTDFSDAPITTFQFVNDLAGAAYFDNYTVFQTNLKIPEPTTLVLGLIAWVAVHGSRRRSTTAA